MARIHRVLILTAAALFVSAPPAAAQYVQSPLREVAEIAEVIGGVHFLRTACEGRDDQSWRLEMVRLLDLEAPEDGTRRRRLVNAFNAGYQRQERAYGVCTPRVRSAEAQLAAEGRRLAERLGARYVE